jgi:DNA-binding response OmpR family regulator
MQLGADDYITKPFSNRDIVERVHRILGEGSGRVAPAGQLDG